MNRWFGIVPIILIIGLLITIEVGKIWKTMENYGKLERRAGVYIFANENLQIKYIGKAGAGRMVLEIDSAIRRGKAFGATLLKALYTNSDANALSLENALKAKYNPPNNLV